MTGSRAARLNRLLLPAFAFKAVVIGGGYATGREIAEYFLPYGPRGGLLAMALAALLWSAVCALTFVFARATQSADYQSFFRALLGRFAFVFEIVYLLLAVLLLSVFGAAAGVLGTALFGGPAIAGTLALAAGIAAAVCRGTGGVEVVFRVVTFLLYGTYGVFFAVCVVQFGGRIGATLSAAHAVPATWPIGGITYASYNIVGAVVILPVLRHLATPREAVVAGLICGPFAMLPALLFFVCMLAAYPAIGGAALPATVLLDRLNIPAFRVLFQLMIFAALLESGTGIVHAVNERFAHAWTARQGRALPSGARLGFAAVLLFFAAFIADRFGLVALIARGYRLIAAALLCVYVLPLFTVGIVRLRGMIRAGSLAFKNSRELQQWS